MDEVKKELAKRMSDLFTEARQLLEELRDTKLPERERIEKQNRVDSILLREVPQTRKIYLGEEQQL